MGDFRDSQKSVGCSLGIHGPPPLQSALLITMETLPRAFNGGEEAFSPSPPPACAYIRHARARARSSGAIIISGKVVDAARPLCTETVSSTAIPSASLFLTSPAPTSNHSHHLQFQFNSSPFSSSLFSLSSLAHQTVVWKSRLFRNNSMLFLLQSKRLSSSHLELSFLPVLPHGHGMLLGIQLPGPEKSLSFS